MRSNRKRISIEVKSNRQIIVRAPYYIRDEELKRILKYNRSWIEKKISTIIDREKSKKENRFRIGSKIPYLGDFYSIVENKYQDIPILFNRKAFLVATEDLDKDFKSWYKIEAYNCFSKIVEKFLHTYGNRVKIVKIGRGKKRLGSCNSKNEITISWRVLALPIHIIEYIVAHEIAHTVRMDHSKLFWAEVDKIYPNYKEAKKWLNINLYKYIIEG